MSVVPTRTPGARALPQPGAPVQTSVALSGSTPVAAAHLTSMQFSAAQTADLTAAIESITGPGPVTDALLAALLPVISGIVSGEVTTQKVADRTDVISRISAMRESLTQQIAATEAAFTTDMGAIVAQAAAPTRPGL